MSATDHGPSNHDDDLSRALRDLVDDASLPGLDTHLDVVRGRTRRRRAAKKVALGATTLCVAGALGVAAIALPQDVRPEPVAPAESPSPSADPTETPAPTPTFPAGIDAAALACQQPAPTPTGDDLPARLSVGVPDLTVQTAGSATAPTLLRFDGDARLRYADSATGAYVVAQGGVIVSSALPAAETTGEATPAPGSSAAWEIDVASSASCGPAGAQPSPLPPGDYEVFALHRFPLTGLSAIQPDGTWGEETTGSLFDGWLVADPVPLTVTEGPDPVVPGAFASPTVSFPFPAEATRADIRCLGPVPEPTGPEMLARLTFDQPRLRLTRGSSTTMALTLAAVPAARVTYQDFTGEIGWAVVKDGRVVSYSFGSTDTSTMVSLDESSAQHDVAETHAIRCDHDGSPVTLEDVLPAGDYELYGIEMYRPVSYSVRLHDGTWGATVEADLTRPPFGFFDRDVVSEPIRLTIE
ncbi:hypothetical protein [Oerskovia enterophila]|uniref:hypothetical protein n=1 Tax=Oerskovia enterophila TaxID=43678 RepID=UPI0037FEAA26